MTKPNTFITFVNTFFKIQNTTKINSSLRMGTRALAQDTQYADKVVIKIIFKNYCFALCVGRHHSSPCQPNSLK